MSEVVLEERDPVADEAFRVLLDWFMVSDPWPLEAKQQGMMLAFLNAEASKRGYDDWIHAFHDFSPEGDDGE